jgi:hypothetical protein
MTNKPQKDLQPISKLTEKTMNSFDKKSTAKIPSQDTLEEKPVKIKNKRKNPPSIEEPKLKIPKNTTEATITEPKRKNCSLKLEIQNLPKSSKPLEVQKFQVTEQVTETLEQIMSNKITK